MRSSKSRGSGLSHSFLCKQSVYDKIREFKVWNGIRILPYIWAGVLKPATSMATSLEGEAITPQYKATELVRGVV